mmetsp:Transcript_45710/g.49349  ORF Transcript_45710/g.49349 Transcript_45710/m.49349 type:complete len:329 (-) Transcript_45710:1023-2009(-)
MIHPSRPSPKRTVTTAVLVFLSCLKLVVRGWYLPTQQASRLLTARPITVKQSFGSDIIHIQVKTTTLFSSSVESSVESSSSPNISTMKLSEIKSELKERKINFSDCFDKESLVLRLTDARQNNKKCNNIKYCDDDGSNNNKKRNEEKITPSLSTPSSKDEFDRDAALEELKGMRVRELREELGRRRIPRAGLFEKEDIISALLEARAKSSVYSATGLLTPGEVSDLDSSTVKKEIDFPGSGLLLLDIYATWCGPCQMIAPILIEIASKEKDKLRIIKMDSDKYPAFASELKVGGFPTLVLFQGGNEIDRLEGAPTKVQLQEWINSRQP